MATGKVRIKRTSGLDLGTLRKGEEIVYNKVSEVSFIRPFDAEIRSAWKSGTTYLSEVSFAELAMVFRNTYNLALGRWTKARTQGSFLMTKETQLEEIEGEEATKLLDN